jgi:hypothetical protein
MKCIKLQLLSSIVNHVKCYFTTSPRLFLVVLHVNVETLTKNFARNLKIDILLLSQMMQFSADKKNH